MTTPPRTIEQRMAALNRANEIRCGRAEIKREIHAGERDLRDIIAGTISDDERELLATEPVLAALLWRPRMGPMAVRRIAEQARLPTRTLLDTRRIKHGGRTLGELWRSPDTLRRLLAAYDEITCGWSTPAPRKDRIA
jgi:hypothetical protein